MLFRCKAYRRRQQHFENSVAKKQANFIREEKFTLRWARASEGQLKLHASIGVIRFVDPRDPAHNLTIFSFIQSSLFYYLRNLLHPHIISSSLWHLLLPKTSYHKLPPRATNYAMWPDFINWNSAIDTLELNFVLVWQQIQFRCKKCAE